MLNAQGQQRLSAPRRRNVWSAGLSKTSEAHVPESEPDTSNKKTEVQPFSPLPPSDPRLPADSSRRHTVRPTAKDLTRAIPARTKHGGRMRMRPLRAVKNVADRPVARSKGIVGSDTAINQSLEATFPVINPLVSYELFRIIQPGRSYRGG